MPIELLPGDPAPWFVAANAANPRYSMSSVAGRYVLLVFPGPAGHPTTAQAYAALTEARQSGLLDDLRCAGFAVCLGRAAEGPPSLRDQLPGLRILWDEDGAAARLYGLLRQGATGELAYTPAAFLLDPLLRVIAGGGVAILPLLLARLRRLPDPALHAGAETPAPVLLLPRVLEPELCSRLIEAYEAGGGAESGFMLEQDGRTVGILDHATKRRRDQEITDEVLRRALRARIGRRIAPEMRKAFQFNPTRIERYIVACYEGANGGHFRAHRDNTTPGTAHRQFAITINLNDAFEGGELCFPEFGARRYRMPAGGAVVFSCSLLHEAAPVTRGRRFATLPFLYDDAAAALREANKQTVQAESESWPAGGHAPPPGQESRRD
ncbi:MAG TPA: 2OG-Fe(II) oxygenase [Crenalkalicoccus sp.]|nr:2OG-Fe(II) oxygenase [Crenalkalicoccus sp.]